MSWAYTRRRSKLSWRLLGTNELLISVGSNLLDVHLTYWISLFPFIWSVMGLSWKKWTLLCEITLLLRSITVALQGENMELGDVIALFEGFFRDICRIWTCQLFMPRYRNRTLKTVWKCYRQTIVQTGKRTEWGWKTGCPCPYYQGWRPGARICWLCWKCFRCEVFKEALDGEGSWAKEKKYTDAHFILSTSDLLEKFFSSAGFAYEEHRQSLLPVNLEEQLFLKWNQSLWNEETVSKFFNETTPNLR